MSIYKLGKKFLLLLFSVIFLAYFAVLLVLYFNQEKLIFFQQKSAIKITEELKKKTNIEEINLQTSDGNNLNGWIIKNDSEQKSRLVIYFGGNAEEVSYPVLSASENLKGYSFATLNYRGYGKSTGTPSEKAVF